MGLLGLKWAMMYRQGPSKQCKRCSLSYFSNQHDKCPHCSELNESELSKLIELKERESEDAAQLGRAMLISAALLLLLLVIVMKLV